MAILRGGRRIGPFDIRLGIPRDKSLNDVQGDKRLGRTMGPNPESTIGRMMATIAEGEGFARPSRFMVDFILPRGVKTEFVRLGLENETKRSTLIGQLTEGNKIQRGLRAYVDSVDMPGRNLDTVDLKIYGPKRQIVNGHSFSGEITMSVYCDKYLRQRSFFEMWQKAAFDQGTNNVHFYDEYTGGLRIYQLGAFSGNQDRDRIAYGVELFECFPKTISAVSYGHGQTDEIQKISVTLAFRNWINLTMDKTGSYTTGAPYGKPTVIRAEDNSLLGGLLNKLPPELKRAGRDVVNTIKQRVPIGAVTGGKVFPPLF
jgi:hypothetical protein